MPSLLIRSILVWMPAYLISLTLVAQAVEREPEYAIFVFADGLPVDLKIGIPITTQTITLKGILRAKSVQDYPLLEHYVIPRLTSINLIRNSRFLGNTVWYGAKLPIKAAFAIGQVQAGDRCLLQFDEVYTQAKNGVTRKLTNKQSCLIPLY